MGDPFLRTAGVAASGVSYDVGLRAHMVRVFNYMGGGLALTGALAFLVSSIPALSALIFGTPLKWLVMLAPLAFMLYMNFRMDQISASKAQMLFWAFCGTMGLSMGAIFLVFTGESVARAFFATAAMFGVMALWGYTTKRDLSGMGSFMMMGLLGLFIASLINLFVGSTMLQWMVSVVGVLVFTGLTAYDMQWIKQSYNESYGAEANNKLAVVGALHMYINFINIFQSLLSLMGDRR